MAVFQTLYASATLYRARGDQIEQYGYAAFGLTVAPYLVMSIVNLVSTILTPSYATTFLVESEIMKEAARRDGARFNGVVGTLEHDQSVTKGTDMAFEIGQQGCYFVRQQHPSSSCTAHGKTTTGVEEAMEMARRRWLIELGPRDNDQSVKPIVLVPACHQSSLPISAEGSTIMNLSLFVGLISLVINGVLTHFKTGKSTRAQRVWTMTWLVFGIVVGSTSHKKNYVEDPGKLQQEEASLSRRYLGVKIQSVKISGSASWAQPFMMLLVYGGSAVGGLVVVCQMLLDYGSCVQMY